MSSFRFGSGFATGRQRSMSNLALTAGCLFSTLELDDKCHALWVDSFLWRSISK